MKDVSHATVEVAADGRRIVDIFPYSLSAPASIVFDVARLKHGESRRLYLATIYQCVSESSKAKMVNEDGVFSRGNRQLFTVEHVWWMHLIHEALHSRQSQLIEEGKQNSHTLIRQKAHYDKWQWQDFAHALKISKRTLQRFYNSTSNIIYKSQEIYEQQPQPSTASRRTTQSQRRSTSSRSSNFNLDDIKRYF